MSERVLHATVRWYVGCERCFRIVFVRHGKGHYAGLVPKAVGIAALDEGIVTIERIPLRPVNVRNACTQSALTEAVRSQILVEIKLAVTVCVLNDIEPVYSLVSGVIHAIPSSV